MQRLCSLPPQILQRAEQSAGRGWHDHFGRCACHSRGQRGHGVAFRLRELVPEPGHHPGRVRCLRIAEQAVHDLALLGRRETLANHRQHQPLLLPPGDRPAQSGAPRRAQTGGGACAPSPPRARSPAQNSGSLPSCGLTAGGTFHCRGLRRTPATGASYTYLPAPHETSGSSPNARRRGARGAGCPQWRAARRC